MAAPNELWKQYETWNARINAVKGQGLNPAPAVEVGTQDLKRIYAGGAPRSVQDIADQLGAAYSGNAVVAAPGPKTGPLDILGNAVHDFGSLVQGVVPAVVHEAGQIVNPAEWVKMGEAFSPSNVKAGEIRQSGSYDTWDFGKAARYLQTVPIVGGLLPGLWTLGSSKKQKLQHPLISLLDVLPFVSEGTSTVGNAIGNEALIKAGETAAHPLGAMVGRVTEGTVPGDIAAGTWQESLTHGKLAQAGIRASGMDHKLVSYLTEHPGIMSEYLHPDVWRKYQVVGRITGKAATDEMQMRLVEAGIIPNEMSREEMLRLSALASTYNDRLEMPATTLTSSTLSDLLGRWNQGPGILPTGDIQAFTSSDIGLKGSGPVFLNKAAAPADAIPVRIQRSDVVFVPDQPGVIFAHNIIHDISYDPRDVPYIQKLRAEMGKESWHGLTVNPNRTRRRPDGSVVQEGPALVRIPTGKGPDAIYAATSDVATTYHTAEKAEVRVNDQTKSTVEAMNKLKAADEKMKGRSGKVYKFGENNEDYFKRPNGEVSILTVRDALTPVTEYFTHTLGEGYPPAIAPLMGEDGLFAQLHDQLTNGDAKLAKGTLSQIARRMRTKTFTDINGSSQLADYVNYIRDEMTNITQKGNRHGSAVRAYNQARKTAKSEMDKLTELNKVADTSRAEFFKTMDHHPEARFRALADQQLREAVTGEVYDRSKQAITLANHLYQGESLVTAIDTIRSTTDEMLQRIGEATRMPQLAKEIGDSASFQHLLDDTVHSWRDLIDAGYNPIWIHRVDSDIQGRTIAGRITPFTESYLRPKAERDTLWDIGNGKFDIAAGVTNTVMDRWRSEASYQFVNWLTDESGVVQSYQKLESELRTTMRPLYPGDPKALNAAIEAHINLVTEPFDPTTYHSSYKTRLSNTDHYVIDKGVAKGLRRLQVQDGFPIHGVWNRGMRIWQVSVLTGARHLVHIGVGGLVFMLGQHPEAFAKGHEAFTKLRSGEIPQEVIQGISEESPDIMWQVATGKWMGNAVLQSMGKRLGSMEHAITTFESFMSDWQRSMVYLSQVDHGMTSEEALAAVHKTFVDLDGMTPFERTVIRRYVYPFWTYTKHALKYILSYPSDHPIRAGILASMYDQMAAEQKSGEPGKLDSLFYLGSPDASGNVQTVDFKNLNPFRSIGGIGTLAGFLQGANPAIQLVARGLGYDPVGGVPMIYQPLTYDAYTGSEKPARPGLGAGQIAETIIPEVGILDHFVGFTSQMRGLKKNSPAGYRAALYNSLNLPFTQTKQNIYDIRARTEHARYTNAAAAVAAAEKGDLSALDGFSYVPFQGYLLPAATVRAYLAPYDKIAGVAPKVLIPTPRHRKKRVL